jgi:hypothetical protein
VVAPIASATVQEKIAYIAPEPLLTQGTLPVTWSLVTRPAGMTVNSATGVVTWPAPVLAATPYTVTLKAVNSAGAATISWKVQVPPQTPPTIAAPQYCTPAQCVVSWSYVPNITGYTLQYDDAADFATPLGTLVLGSTTFKYSFSTLAPDKTYWFRVRGNKLPGLTSVWSKVTSSTLDVTPPTGTVQINGGAATTHLSLVRLTMTWRDSGKRPSGVYQFRLSENGRVWDAWHPATTVQMFSLFLDAQGQDVYVQFRDRAGNVSNAAQARILLAYPLVNPICIDAANTTGPWNGTALYPYRRISDALYSGATLYVATGVYAESVNFPNGTRIYGGFPHGFDYTRRDATRCISTITPAGSLSSTQRTGVSMISVQNTVLDGFRITGCGRKDYFVNNSAAWGAGVYCQNIGRDCTISSCVIVNNQARNTSTTVALKGGGVYLNNATPVLSHCVIANNIANDGGGIYFANISNAILDSCLIKDNRALPVKTGGAGGHGGGIYCASANPMLQNCIMATNSPSGVACNPGAAYLYNCTFFNNGITNSRGPIFDCIVWGGSLAGCTNPFYSCIQNWTLGGTKNINADPQFVNAAGGDFHLKPTSPCIDAGGRGPGLKLDFDNKPRPVSIITTSRGDNSHYDMGALEYRK